MNYIHMRNTQMMQLNWRFTVERGESVMQGLVALR